MEGQPERRRWNRRAIILVSVGVIVVVGGAALTGLWHVSASPQFCNSCHLMRPYVQAWTVSMHNNVPCVQCHYPPGFRDTLWVKYQAMTQVVKWATQTYSSKPFAVVEDGSCLRSGCHSAEKLQVPGGRGLGRGIRFDHRPHLDPGKSGRELRCTSCHFQIVVEKHFEVATSTCFLCHFKGTKTGRELTPITGCTGCHEPPKGDVRVGSITFNHADVVKRGVACQKCHLNVVEGDGDAPRERCFSCHNQPEKVKQYGDTALLHKVHTAAHNIECTRCHNEIKHRLPPPIGAPSAEGTRTDLLARLGMP